VSFVGFIATPFVGKAAGLITIVFLALAIVCITASERMLEKEKAALAEHPLHDRTIDVTFRCEEKAP
jgi:hypothetical protein